MQICLSPRRETENLFGVALLLWCEEVWAINRLVSVDENLFLEPKSCSNDVATGNLSHQSNYQYF